MYQAVGSTTETRYTVYITGQFVDEIFKWIMGPPSDKLTINPVPTSSYPIRAGRHQVEAIWSVSQIVVKKKKKHRRISDWQTRRHDINLADFEVTFEMTHEGMEIYKLLSYDHHGGPRIVKNLLVKQPALARAIHRLPLQLVKYASYPDSTAPAVLTALHPYADHVGEIKAWKRDHQIKPHTPAKKRPASPTAGPSRTPTKALETRTKAPGTPTKAPRLDIFQTSIANFFDPKPTVLETRASPATSSDSDSDETDDRDTENNDNTVIGVLTGQAGNMTTPATPANDSQAADLILAMEHTGQNIGGRRQEEAYPEGGQGGE